jgi:hypothetical protein
MCIDFGRKSICGVHFGRAVLVSKLNLFNARTPPHFFPVALTLGEKLQAAFRARWRASCFVSVGFGK